MYKKTPYNSIISVNLFKALINLHRLWNLYLALSEGLSARKIELYGVFYLPPHYCYKRLVVCKIYL